MDCLRINITQRNTHMNPKQALEILDQATQPGVRLNRDAYIHVEEAIRTLAKLIDPDQKKSEVELKE